MTHPVVYAIGLGVALGAAIYMYFAHENQQFHDPYAYVPRPPPRQAKSQPKNANPSTNSTGNAKRKLDICTICLEDVKGDSKTLECSHVFHGNCIKGLQEPKCPNCRKMF